MTRTEDAPKPTPKAPDGGWGWVVVACAFFNSIFIADMPFNFGVIFNEKLTMMGVPSTTMTWIYNLFNFNFYLSSVFAGPLSDVFSWRSVGFVTAAIIGLGYAFMVFASGPGHIFLLFSVVVGCSAGQASVIGLLVFPHYFDLHRGRAGAIITTGMSAGQIVIPLLVRQLQDEYGFSGSCLLFAGLLFNCAVANLLFYSVQKRPLIKGDMMYETMKKTQENQLLLKDKLKSPSHTRKLTEKRSDSSQIPRRNITEILRLTWLHLHQLHYMTLLIVTLSYSLLIEGGGNYTALVPFAMTAAGHRAADATHSLSVSGFASIAVRIFIIWASDADWFSRKICYILGAVVSGASALATVFLLHDSRFIMACQIFWSSGIVASVCVYHNLIIDTCGRELYDAGMVVTSLLTAVCNVVLGPLIGVARDHTSYGVAIGLTAASHLLGSALWAFMPLARRHDTSKFRELQVTVEKSEKIQTKPQRSNFSTVDKKKLDE